MDQRYSWECEYHSVSEDIPRLVLNRKIHYRLYNIIPFGPILRYSVFKINSNIILKSTLSFAILYRSFRFSDRKFVFISPLFCATCRFIYRLDLIKNWPYKSWNSLLIESFILPSCPVPSTYPSILFPSTFLRRKEKNLQKATSLLYYNLY